MHFDYYYYLNIWTQKTRMIIDPSDYRAVWISICYPSESSSVTEWVCRDATREKQVRRVCWDGEETLWIFTVFSETNKVLPTNFRWPKCSRCYLVQLGRIQNITFLVIIDCFLLDLRKRIKAYSKVDELFSSLRHTDVEADVSLNGVVDFYSEDLEDLNAVENEWFQWRSLLKNLDVTFCSPSEMLKLMVQMISCTSLPKTQTPTFFFVSWLFLWRNVPVSAHSVTSNASNLL